MRSRLPIVIAAAGLVAFGTAEGRAAAEQPPQPAVQTSSASASSSAVRRQQQVTIEAQRELEPKVSAFVNNLTDIGDPTTGMARWHDGLCPLVSGISAEQGNYVLDRISEIAQAAGAPLGGKKCLPNVFIFVSTKPEALLQDLVKRNRLLLFENAQSNLIAAFISTPRPVRAWYDTVQMTPEGLPILHMGVPGQHGSQMAWRDTILSVNPQPDSASKAGTNQWSQASHLTLNGVWWIYRVVEVVDATRLKGASLGQLADYVAVCALAQIDLDARLGDAPTILSLFAEAPQAASPGVTDWDRAFLKFLYSTQQQTVIQRREIALDMVREIAP